MQAWILKRLISIFGRAARRGHVPRELAMKKIYEAAGIPLPESAFQAHGIDLCLIVTVIPEPSVQCDS